jgi:SOS-response transcriptional repressor LexA
VTCVPLVPLKAAAGAFSDPQHVTDHDFAWVQVNSHSPLRPGMFVAQVAGHSMEPGIEDGSYCLFAAPVTGTREGRTVLVQLRDSTDPETGQRYTVKRYESDKTRTESSWRHTTITLRPTNPAYAPIVLQSGDDDAVQVVAEFVEALGPTPPVGDE